MAINDKQLDALTCYCDDIADRTLRKDWIKDHVTIKTDSITNTVTIEIWDMDDQDFKDFEV